MQVSLQIRQLQSVPADALIVGQFEDDAMPAGATAGVDTALGASDGLPGDGAISRLLATGDFKARLGDVTVIYPNGLIPAARVLLVGLGRRMDFDADAAAQASGSALRKAQALGCKRVASVAHGLAQGMGGGPLDALAAARATVQGALAGTYQFREHKGNPKITRQVSELLLVEHDQTAHDALAQGLREGQAIGEAVNSARSWVNRAPNALTPAGFAELTQAMANENGLRCTVFEESQIAMLGMGGLIGVAQGSSNPPRFVVLEYVPPGAETRPPLVLIGKGVTFDSGGYSIKQSAGMLTMKGDMAGAAAVIATMQALAVLKTKRRVIALAPMTENLISGAAMRVGDVLTLMDGQTIEIVNTDAEGRLILADALHYAKRFQPEAVIDIATLTAQSMIAMGDGIGATLMSNDDALANGLLRAAAQAGERLWRMPIYPEHMNRIASDVADMKNSAGEKGGLGASAAVLKRVVDNSGRYRWAHIDMAGMAFSAHNHGAEVRGASGFGVATLLAFVLDGPEHAK